jgi:hypothetical protein
LAQEASADAGGGRAGVGLGPRGRRREVPGSLKAVDNGWARWLNRRASGTGPGRPRRCVGRAPGGRRIRRRRVVPPGPAPSPAGIVTTALTRHPPPQLHMLGTGVGDGVDGATPLCRQCPPSRGRQGSIRRERTPGFPVHCCTAVGGRQVITERARSRRQLRSWTPAVSPAFSFAGRDAPWLRGPRGS